MLVQTHPQHDKEGYVHRRTNQHRIPKNIRYLGHHAGNSLLSGCRKILKGTDHCVMQNGLPLSIWFEAGKNGPNCIGTPTSAIQELSLPVRLPVTVDGEKCIITHQRLDFGPCRLRIAVQIRIQWAQQSCLRLYRLCNSLVVVICRNCQKTEQQTVKQVEPRSPEADIMVEIRAGPKEYTQAWLDDNKPKQSGNDSNH